MITEWFPIGTAPARDGCYITRLPKSDNQHVFRWNCKSGYWYSAGSTGSKRQDVIGWDSGADVFEWRGLAQEPKP
jgi:hypothetical protein